MKFKVKLLFVLSFLFFTSIFIAFAFSFSGFGYPTSASGEKTAKISLGLGESWSFASGHLGEDYLLGENAPVYSIADGIVFKVASWPECPNSASHGWGGVVIIKHQIPDNINKNFDTTNATLHGSPAISNPKVVYSMYGHLKNIQVKEGETIKKGSIIGEVGKVCKKNGGTYAPHLHFEVKDQSAIEKDVVIENIPGIGHGYSGRDGYAPNRYIPSKFIENNKDLIIKEETPNKNSNSNQGKSSIVRPSPTPTKGEGAIGKEPILSFWDKFLFQTKRIINSFKFKEDIQEKKPLKSIPAISSKSPVWRQRLIERSVPTWTFILGESQPINRVKFKFQNIGNTTWRKDEVFLNIVGGYQGTAAKLYHKSWITKLRPCGFQENEVKPGQSGTFEFIFSYPQKEGKYYAQFSLSRYDKKQNKWYWIEGDRAILYITVKKKSSILSYGSANVSKAFSWNSSSSNQNQNNNQNNTQSQNSPPQNSSLPLSNQEENNPNTSLLSFPMAHYNTSKTGWLPFLGPYQNPQKEIFISDSPDSYGSYFVSPSIDSKGNFYFKASLNNNRGLYSFDPKGNLRFFVGCDNFSSFCSFTYYQPTIFEKKGLVFDVLSTVLFATDIQTGKVLWQKTFYLVYSNQYPIIDNNGKLYFVASACLANRPCFEKDQNGNFISNLKDGLFSFDAQTGKLNWFYSFKENKKYQENEISLNREEHNYSFNAIDITMPTIDDKGLIYIGYKNKLFVINQDGNILKKKEFVSTSSRNGISENCDEPLTNYIAIKGDNLYISVTGEKHEGCNCCIEGQLSCLHSLNKNTLEENWQNPFCPTGYPLDFFAVNSYGDIFLVPSWYSASSGGSLYSYLYVLSSSGQVKKNKRIKEGGFIKDVFIDKEDNIYLLIGGTYSHSLHILNKELDYQGLFYFRDYSSGTFSIAPDGNLYIGVGKILYKIFSSK